MGMSKDDDPTSIQLDLSSDNTKVTSRMIIYYCVYCMCLIIIDIISNSLVHYINVYDERSLLNNQLLKCSFQFQLH